MAISTPRDANFVPTALGTLNTDGVTVVSIVVTASNNGVTISDGTTGTAMQTTNAQRDANRVPAWWGVSSADGITPIPIAVTAAGAILIKTT